MESAIGKPTVFQQRMTLILFLVVIGVLIWWQNTNVVIVQSVQKFSATELPSEVLALDFGATEDSWSGLSVDAQGSLVIDAHLESALVQVNSLLAGDKSEIKKERMTLLLNKQFGKAAAQEFIELLPVIKTYKEAEQRWWAENGKEVPPPFEGLYQLQDKMLGPELARTMFYEQRRLTKLMQANFQITNDGSLSQEEKEQALKELRQEFQEDVPNG